MSTKKVVAILIVLSCLLLSILSFFLIKGWLEKRKEFITIEHEGEPIDLGGKTFKCIDGTIGTIQKFENPYLFLDDEISEYIISVCNEFGVNSNFAVALLQTENPDFDPLAKSRKNKNKSRDVGLWQLNTRYLDWYQNRYWDNDTEFDVFNWKHNTYIAIRYISSLSYQFDNNFWYVAAAYNCGPGTVSKEYKHGLKKIPHSTRNIYVPSVINSMKNLENQITVSKIN